jgi:cardiolipin synthase (CMP-forming)
MSVLTAANQLTLLRMLLIPAFVILVIYGQLGWALVVFMTAGITDGLDGVIARRSGQNSSLGAWLDPMADKLLLVTTFIVLTLPNLGLANRLPIWLTVLIIFRDVGIVLTVAIVNLASGPRTFRPSVLGKIATATYILTAVVAMWFNFLGYHSIVFDFFVYGSLAITLASGLHYIWHARRIIDAGSPARERTLGSDVGAGSRAGGPDAPEHTV